ncbi:methionyl-tRNA formyltransferase [Microcella daejeonensis]|uniref:Methionyl-tRNA formyltransferase n=1 Tax=Microcella daejeonensis TaxID=2994971 RepID=A0A9E8MNK1_9MICO|nr:methionyl-tRNA formyltransferase [Microcella daejeonensis]WAB82788.1 methionyl-tRNA formyltransferase [Microcella daejeonensis]
MRLVVAGSPAAAVPTLDALAAGPHEIVRVITRPASPLGRKRVITPTPVAQAAERHGIPVVEAARLADVQAELLELEVDLGVIVAYGGLVRAPLLQWPRLGWINLHFSLLPAWRGAAPVQRAIMAGEERTGATVFQLTEGLDEGDWYARLEEPIGAHRTAGALLESLSNSGAALTARVVDELAAGTAVARPQEGEVTLAPKLVREDARIHWDSPVDAVHARVRGVTPEPGAFTTIIGSDAVLKVLEAAPAREAAPLAPGRLALLDGRPLVGTASQPLELLRVQPAGKPAMPAVDWARGLDAAALPELA